MPIQNGSYVSPTWHDNGPPSMDAAEMQAISDTTEQTRNDKADIDSPALTGTPTVPNPTDGDNSNQIATTAFVRASAANAYPTDTASGSIATFPDGADNIPVKTMTVQITPAQSGSGDPSPTNVRPITGWTGAEIADISDYQPYFAGLLNGTYGFVDLGTLTWAQGSTSFYATLTGVKQVTSTVVANALCRTYPTVALDDITGGTVDKAIAINQNNPRVNVRDTSYSDATAFKAAMSGVYLIYELATPTTPTITPSQYETLVTAFGLQGWIVTVTWTDEGTVYGGTVLPLTGDLTAQMRGVDLGSLTWTATAISNGRTAFTAPYSSFPVAPYIDTNAMPNALSPVAKGQYQNADSWGTNRFLYYVTGSTLPEYTIAFIFNDGTYADATAFKTAMNGLYFVYQINTEQTYQLDPVTVTTLLGNNNVWADCGPLTLTYRADTALYIAKIINS